MENRILLLSSCVQFNIFNVSEELSINKKKFMISSRKYFFFSNMDIVALVLVKIVYKKISKSYASDHQNMIKILFVATWRL
jgi:hypothetical protein